MGGLGLQGAGLRERTSALTSPSQSKWSNFLLPFFLLGRISSLSLLPPCWLWVELPRKEPSRTKEVRLASNEAVTPHSFSLRCFLSRQAAKAQPTAWLSLSPWGGGVTGGGDRGGQAGLDRSEAALQLKGMIRVSFITLSHVCCMGAVSDWGGGVLGQRGWDNPAGLILPTLIIQPTV